MAWWPRCCCKSFDPTCPSICIDGEQGLPYQYQVVLAKEDYGVGDYAADCNSLFDVYILSRIPYGDCTAYASPRIITPQGDDYQLRLHFNGDSGLPVDYADVILYMQGRVSSAISGQLRHLEFMWKYSQTVGDVINSPVNVFDCANSPIPLGAFYGWGLGTPCWEFVGWPYNQYYNSMPRTVHAEPV